MKLLSLKKVHDGRYLKNYELTYENKAGRNKVYEIVSRKELHDMAEVQAVYRSLPFRAINCSC